MIASISGAAFSFCCDLYRNVVGKLESRKGITESHQWGNIRNQVGMSMSVPHTKIQALQSLSWKRLQDHPPWFLSWKRGSKSDRAKHLQRGTVKLQGACHGFLCNIYGPFNHPAPQKSRANSGNQHFQTKGRFLWISVGAICLLWILIFSLYFLFFKAGFFSLNSSLTHKSNHFLKKVLDLLHWFSYILVIQ